MSKTLKPICFMVMPFGIKTVEPAIDGAPHKIDFDALWNLAYQPLIAELGYEPVRADQDAGASIILEMLERLFYSDLVVADMTLPNGNVYYEIGVRHASREKGCILISADWARPLFDLDQMKRIVFPLPEGVINATTALPIQAALRMGAGKLASGLSPMYQHIPGFPDPKKADPQRASAIRAQLQAISTFQTQVRAARQMHQRDKGQARELALALVNEHPPGQPMSQVVALELLTLMRDVVGWKETLAYIEQLPPDMQMQSFVREQSALALSKSDKHDQAIAALESLIAERGDSSERQGLIGGRYKKLADQEAQAGNRLKARVNLDRAIDHYERGMRLDLNDFFPSSNLPFLYRERGNAGDEARAAQAALVARLACERDSGNEWAKPTLLTLAFFDQDVARAQEYAREVLVDGTAAWKLKSTLDTLQRAVNQTADPTRRADLATILADLRSLC